MKFVNNFENVNFVVNITKIFFVIADASAK
jgi:hypothetical protein